MAGKGYPSQRAALPVRRPSPGFQGDGPANDNRGPRVPWKPPVRRPPRTFPKFPRPPVKPFGRGGLLIPDPILPRPSGSGLGWIIGLGPFVGALLYAPTKVGMPSEWTLCWDLGGPKQAQSKGFSGCSDFYKNLGFQPPHGGLGDPMQLAYDTTAVWFGPYNNPEQSRMSYTEMWSRPYPSPEYELRPQIYPPLWIDQPPFRPLDPQELLPLQPEPLPVPNPVPYVRPWPGAQGNGSPRPRPDTRPDVRTQTNASGTRGSRTNHIRRRPRKREYETKYTSSRRGWGAVAAYLLKIASGAYGGMTELVDFLTAFYSAIPAEIIAKHPDNIRPADIVPFMLGQIYQNRHLIDYDKALVNLVKNQVEDSLWGKYFKALDTTTKGGINVSGFDRELNNLFDSIGN